RSSVFCAFGCVAVFGQCGFSRPRASVQTFRGCVSPFNWAHSEQRDPSEESAAAHMGSRHSRRLRAAAGAEHNFAEYCHGLFMSANQRAGIFYGWWVVAAAFLNFFFVIGIIFYGFPVFYASFVEALGFTRAQVTQGFFLGFLIAGLPAGLFAGAVI